MVTSSRPSGVNAIAVGATNADGAGRMIAETRALTDRPFNVNLFVHAAPQRDTIVETAWLHALTAQFEAFGATPPAGLDAIYQSFADDDAMLARLIADAPAVVSFHFGLPGGERIRALKQAGCLLLATATNLDEALACKAAGVDAVVAQARRAGRLVV